jgi:NAD-dependent deacetylase
MSLRIRDFQHIVCLTGAGISAESGLATFRDQNGLWENHRVEDVATPEAFQRDPGLVWRFYSLRRELAARAKPNPAHVALDEFAATFAGHFVLVTQNVDGLHQRAAKVGHLEPLCMHGTLAQSSCSGCGAVYWDDRSWVNENSARPLSTGLLRPEELASPEALNQYTVRLTPEGLPLAPCCQALLRPHIVWFGEIPLHMERITREISRCDLFISIGTSGLVYPAAGFLELAKRQRATTVCLNLEPLPQSPVVDHFIQGPASLAVPRLFNLCD